MIYIKKAYLFLSLLVIISLLLYSFFSVSKCIISTQSSNVLSRNTVVIDAGHGGIDGGTVGTDGTIEKDVNLSISLKLYDFLMVSGINAKLIRNSDTEYYPKGSDTSKSDLYNRLDFVNSVENSVLISIHQNHYSSPDATGAQIWYSPDNEKSRVIADSILYMIKNNLQNNNNRTNEESGSAYYIIYHATNPSLLLECGFMSNPEENKNLQDNKYQNDISFSVLEGICEEV